MRRLQGRVLGWLALLTACSGRHVTSDEAGGSSNGGMAGAGAAAGAGATAGAGASAGSGASAGMDAGGAGGTDAGGAGAGPVVLSPWPGGADVVTVDAAGQFLGNFSGLTYEPGSVLWGVSNIPGKLFRVLRSGPSTFETDPNDGWPPGKLLHYPGGGGEADAESVTFAETSSDGLYVVAEHDNDDPAVSRTSVLRYDPTGSDPELSATHEWDVTSALPPLGANLGPEAITWLPDAYLIERGFFDEATNAPYDPGVYPGHGTGLFFIGVEQTGMLYGFALNHDDESSTLLSSFQTPFAGVMGLEMDRDLGQLWVYCDDTCGNQAGILDIDAGSGRFTLRGLFARPTGLINTNHEGIALAPESECEADLKPFFWADDNDTDGHSIRQGTVRCGVVP